MFSQKGYISRIKKSTNVNTERSIGDNYLKEKERNKSLIFNVKESQKNDTQQHTPSNVMENKSYKSYTESKTVTKYDDDVFQPSVYEEPKSENTTMYNNSYFDQFFNEADDKKSNDDEANTNKYEKDKTDTEDETQPTNNKPEENKIEEKEPNDTESVNNTTDTEDENSGNDNNDTGDIDNSEENTGSPKNEKERNYKVSVIKNFNTLIGIIDRIHTKMDVFKHKDELTLIKNQKTFETLENKLEIVKKEITDIIIDKAYDIEFKKLAIIYTHYKSQVLLLSEIFLNIFVDNDTKNKINELKSIKK